MAKRHAAADALLHASLSKVPGHLAAGLRNHFVGIKEPEEALFEVFRAADTTAVEL